MVEVPTSYCQLEILKQIESSTKRNLSIYSDAYTGNGDSSIFSYYIAPNAGGCVRRPCILVVNPSRAYYLLVFLQNV